MNMDRPRASRLQEKQGSNRPKIGFLTRWLPYGTLKRKLTLWVAVPLVSFILVVLIVDRIVMPIITRHGEEFTLPNFTSLTIEEAEVELTELDLRHEIASELYSPGKEAGVILQQYPEPGTQVKSGRAIKFVVSLGKKMVPIPDLAGKSVRQAMLDLEANGLTLGEIAWAYSDTIPERVVVFSYPNATTEIPLGSPVNLMVNRGRASNFTYMPDLVGMPLSEAQKKLEDKLLKVGVVSYRTDENFLPETVLEQSEPEGAELDVNTEIDLVVSSTS
ncbi:PASTA domain-containing protein [candidate division GN15 bacterium]|nr:PASTA domain-containing protein [candidate division GN15 bacterium]